MRNIPRDRSILFERGYPVRVVWSVADVFFRGVAPLDGFATGCPDPGAVLPHCADRAIQPLEGGST
jgi:hypothetical protein